MPFTKPISQAAKKSVLASFNKAASKGGEIEGRRGPSLYTRWKNAKTPAERQLIENEIPARAEAAAMKLRARKLANLPDATWAGPGWKVMPSSGNPYPTAPLARQQGAAWLFSANLKPALRELAARSGRIVEFGDGDADEAVLGALKAVASADETPAQRAMLLKRGLIEMVKGQVVINERGYEMMQKAGVPPKLTPEERREEIAGTEEKRLSRFDHRGHRERRVEFARGDYAIPALKKILVGSQGLPVDQFNKMSPIFKGKFPKAAYRAGFLPSRTASSATRSDILEAIAPIRKEAAQALRAARKR